MRCRNRGVDSHIQILYDGHSTSIDYKLYLKSIANFHVSHSMNDNIIIIIAIILLRRHITYLAVPSRKRLPCRYLHWRRLLWPHDRRCVLPDRACRMLDVFTVVEAGAR